jgi:hypothetical protein
MINTIFVTGVHIHGIKYVKTLRMIMQNPYMIKLRVVDIEYINT